MKQRNLYGEDAYGSPIVHANDPASSRHAADRHTRSGKRTRNADLVLALVKVYPRKTANELWELASDGDKAQLGDYYEVRRRLDDLRDAGKIRVHDERKCTVKGSLMQTWETV
jgi:hypothetical protein